MKAIKPKNGKAGKKNWILPETRLTRNEFISGIREAEKGPFSTVQESMEQFEKWLHQREKNVDTCQQNPKSTATLFLEHTW